MKEYFNGFSTQDLVDMKRNDDERKEKTEMRKEIERLNNDIKVLLKENENKEKVIIAQDNIIKEVREYIKQNEFYLDYKTGACIKGVMPLLEILDKVNKEE